jgi:hypothetical protein
MKLVLINNNIVQLVVIISGIDDPIIGSASSGFDSHVTCDNTTRVNTGYTANSDGSFQAPVCLKI